jgi:hypothetical protein
MVFHLFDNKILTTPKCGTRHLRQVWGSEYLKYNEITDFSNIKYIIIREPFEHFKSALHTEFLWHTDMYGYPINLKVYFDKLLLKKNVVHWSYDMYEIMYWIYIKNNKKTEIIHLSSLTDLIKKEGKNINFNQSDYDFHLNENWISKEDFFNELLNNFPTQMQILLKQLDKQTIFYNKLINNTIETQSLI